MNTLPYATESEASAWFREKANPNDWEDCEACGASDDICPVHYGMELGIQHFSRVMSRIAADPELTSYIPNELLVASDE